MCNLPYLVTNSKKKETKLVFCCKNIIIKKNIDENNDKLLKN